jgi:hypothetical protein
MLAIPLLVYYEKSRRDDLFVDNNGNRKDPISLSGITDERWFWTHDAVKGKNLLELQSQYGKFISKYFQNLPVSVLISFPCFAYYERFSTCIDCYGLTDKYIAHLPLEKRTRPGHEKKAPLEYLEQRKVNFNFTYNMYDTSFYRNAYFRVGSRVIGAELITYDFSLLATLKSRFPNNIFFYDFRRYLDNYLLSAATKTKTELDRDYKKFSGFYFRHTKDTVRDNRFRRLLGMTAIN